MIRFRSGLVASALSTDPADRPVDRFGCTSGEGDTAAVEPDCILDLLARHLDRGFRLAAPARRRVRVRVPIRRPRAASPRQLREQPASSPGNRGRSCGLRPTSTSNSPPFGEEAVDFGFGRVRTEADAKEAGRNLRRDLHGGEHPTRLHLARRAGASGRNSNARQVQLDEERGIGCARHRNGPDGRNPRRTFTDDEPTGLLYALSEAATKRTKTFHVVRPSRKRGREPERRGSVLRPSTIALLLASDGFERPQILDQQDADARRTAELVRAGGDEIGVRKREACPRSVRSRSEAASRRYGPFPAFRSIGWITPVSLLTCWIATSAGPARQDFVERLLVDQAVGRDRNDVRPDAHRVRHDRMFGRAVGPPLDLRPLRHDLDGFARAAGEDDVMPPAEDLSDGRSRFLEQGARGSSLTVR